VRQVAAWFLIVGGSVAALLGVVAFRFIPYRFRWDRTGRQLARMLRHGGLPFDSSTFQWAETRGLLQDLAESDPSVAAVLRDQEQRFKELEQQGADPLTDARKFFRFLNVAMYTMAGLLLLGVLSVVLGVALLRSA